MYEEMFKLEPFGDIDEKQSGSIKNESVNQDRMFELDIFRENENNKEERKLDELIAKKKKELKERHSKTGFVDLGEPFGGFSWAWARAYFDGQMLKGPRRLKKGIGRPILGTNIFVREENGEYIRETVTNPYEDEENNEENDTKPNINKILLEHMDWNEIENYIHRFGDRFNIPIKIVHQGSALYKSMQKANLAFCTIELNENNIQQLEQYDDIVDLYFTGVAKSHLVIIALEAIAETLKEEICIKHLLLHEYGHFKTMPKIPLKKWLEYFLKIRIVNGVPSLYGIIDMREYRELLNVYQSVYYNLYPELMANRYVNLDFRVLLRDLHRTEPPSNWDKSRLARIINISPTINIYPILEKWFIRRESLSDSEYAEYSCFMTDLYHDCFSPKTANILIADL